MIHVERVTSPSDLKTFIHFPHQLYGDDPNYVPQLNIAINEHLNRKKNPFFRHSSAHYYLAIKDGKIVGRISTINNTAHNERYKERTAFFGFFDSINDLKVAQALFNQVRNDAREWGFDNIIGPENFTTNDASGILVDGFQFPPKVLMPYNAPYYEELLEQCGFSKAIDLFSWQVTYAGIPPKVLQTVEKVGQRLGRSGIRIRSIDFGNFEEEITTLRAIYNQANENNWGFLPLNEAEFLAMARDLKQIVPEELVIIAEKEGEMIGFLLAVPDLNQILIKIRNGRLLPFGIFRLLFEKKHIDAYRVMLIGVDGKYRGIGIDVALYGQLFKTSQRLGVYQAEACYVMEDNEPMLNLLKKLQAAIIKKYRLYKTPL